MPHFCTTGFDMLEISNCYTGVVFKKHCGRTTIGFFRKRNRSLAMYVQQKVGLPYFYWMLRNSPVNREWGNKRGRPVDRLYIENFLLENKMDIKGKVLSVGDDVYTRRFQVENVTSSDILHVQDNQGATIVADLSNAPHIESNRFDCFILVQTLQFIYDMHRAIETVYRILKPGGIVLVTVPGITPLKDPEWNDSWYWSFTVHSVTKMFEEYFPADNVQVQTRGNIRAATAFLHGLSVQDCGDKSLLIDDPMFPVILTVRAQKPIDQ